jgi:hypothetical protein
VLIGGVIAPSSIYMALSQTTYILKIYFKKVCLVTFCDEVLGLGVALDNFDGSIVMGCIPKFAKA